MKGIILAAGLGRRIRSLTKGVPKPMLCLRGRPIIEYTIRLFRKFGIKDIIINLHYKPDLIVNYLKDGKKFGVRIKYSYEPVLLGTAGAVKKIQPLLNGTFLVAYGDTLRNIDIADLLKKHSEAKADVTIALYRTKDLKRCVVAMMRADNSIYEFIEKPRQKIVSGYANCGIYCIEPRVLNSIPRGRKCEFGKELFPLLIKRGFRIYGYPTDAGLLDIGTPASYARAKKIFSATFKNL
mgnify:CR=1 FL=1